MPPDFGKVSKCSLHHFSYTCETRHLVTPKNTIVRFVTRKFCKKALEAKFDSQNVSNAELHFDTISVLHFSENLTPYNQYLAWKCRELKRANLIHSTWSSKSLIKIRRSMNEKPIPIEHENDIFNLYPTFVFKENHRPIKKSRCTFFISDHGKVFT